MSLTTDAIACGCCPNCFRPVDSRASKACPRCHALRKAHLAEMATRGVGGQSCTDEDEAKMRASGCGSSDEERRKKQSGARSGRVMRKGEIYGG